MPEKSDALPRVSVSVCVCVCVDQSLTSLVFYLKFIPLSSFYRLRNVSALPLILVRTKRYKLVPSPLGTHAMNYALLKLSHVTPHESFLPSVLFGRSNLRSSHSLDSTACLLNNIVIIKNARWRANPLFPLPPHSEINKIFQMLRMYTF